MAFTKRASSGKGKPIYPHIPPNTATTKKTKTTDNGPTQTMLKVTWHVGRRQTQMDPLSPICPKQSDSHPKAAVAPCFPQLLPWQQNPTSSCTAQMSATGDPWPWLCAGHLLTGLWSACTSPFCTHRSSPASPSLGKALASLPPGRSQ